MVVPPLGVVEKEVAVLIVLVRRHRCAVGAAVRRAVDDEVPGVCFGVRKILGLSFSSARFLRYRAIDKKNKPPEFREKPHALTLASMGTSPHPHIGLFTPMNFPLFIIFRALLGRVFL